MKRKNGFGGFGLVVGVAMLMLVGSLGMVAHPAKAALTPEWVATYSMGTNRTQAVVVQDDAGLVYVIGGVRAMSGSGSWGSSWATVSSYNMTTGAWTSLAPMPEGVRGAAGAYLDGKIYVMAGVNTTKIALTQIYDVATNAWSFGAVVPEASWEAKAAPGGGGLVYLMGGETNASSYSNVVRVYDPSLDSWSVGVPLPTGTKAGAAVSSGGYYPVYIGGETAGGLTTNVQEFIPYSSSWFSMSSLPVAAAGLAATIGADRFIYVLGGAASSLNVGAGFNTSYYFNPSDAVWMTGPNLTVGARYLGAAASSDGRILAIGGNDASIVLNRVEAMRIMSVTAVVSPSTVEQGGSVTVSITADFAFAVPDAYGISVALVSGTVTYPSIEANTPLPGTAALVVPVPNTVAPGQAYIYVFSVNVDFTSGGTSLAKMWLPVTVTAAPATDPQIASLQQNNTLLREQLNLTNARLNQMNSTLVQDNSALQDKLDKVKADASNASLYGMIAMVLVVVVIIMAALMIMMNRKPGT